MKVTVKEKESDITYPCLMISGSHVVFFTKREKGISLTGSSVHEVGEYSKGWIMQAFKPFTGTITLSND